MTKDKKKEIILDIESKRNLFNNEDTELREPDDNFFLYRNEFIKTNYKKNEVIIILAFSKIKFINNKFKFFGLLNIKLDFLSNKYSGEIDLKKEEQNSLFEKLKVKEKVEGYLLKLNKM